MKLKLSQIVRAYDALARVGSEKLPIKLAYTIQRNMRLMESDVRQHENTRVELIKTKYGVKDESGNFSVPEKRVAAFQKQITDLGSVEVDLDIHTVNLDEVEFMQIAPIDLMALDWMFTNGETPANQPKKRRRR